MPAFRSLLLPAYSGGDIVSRVDALALHPYCQNFGMLVLLAE